MDEKQNEWAWDKNEDTISHTDDSKPVEQPKYGRIASPEEKEKFQKNLAENNNAYTSYNSYESVTGTLKSIIPIKQLSLSDIIDSSFKALRKGFKQYFLTSLFVNTLLTILSLPLGAITIYSAFDALYLNGDLENMANIFANKVLPAVIAMIIVSMISTIATFSLSSLITSDLIVNDLKSPFYYLKQVFRKSHKILFLTLLILILTLPILLLAFITIFIMFEGNAISVTLGILFLLALIVTVCIIGIKCSLTIQALFIENTSIFKAIKRSWSLSKKFLLKIFGTLFIANILVAVIGGVFSTILQQPLLFFIESSIEYVYIIGILILVINSLINAITSVFLAIVNTLLYVDLRIRKEALDLEIQKALNESK